MSRTAVTAPAGPYFLAISAFHGEATRSRIDPGSFHATLESLLGEIDRALATAGVDPELAAEVKYALVALADELALHTDWDHSEPWRQNLLEIRHFNTSFAGAEFFERVQRLAQQLPTARDAERREQLLGVLEIYFTCLRMGFEGSFRNQSSVQLESTIAGLLAMLWPPGSAGLHQRVFADAYMDAGKGRVIRRKRWWWWPIPVALVAAIALWFGFSFRQEREVKRLVQDQGAELRTGDDREEPL